MEGNTDQVRREGWSLFAPWSLVKVSHFSKVESGEFNISGPIIVPYLLKITKACILSTGSYQGLLYL